MKRWQSCTKIILNFNHPIDLPEYCIYCKSRAVRRYLNYYCNTCRYELYFTQGKLYSFYWNFWDVQYTNNQIIVKKYLNPKSNYQAEIQPGQSSSQIELSNLMNKLELSERLYRSVSKIRLK